MTFLVTFSAVYVALEVTRNVTRMAREPTNCLLGLAKFQNTVLHVVIRQPAKRLPLFWETAPTTLSVSGLYHTIPTGLVKTRHVHTEE